MNFWLWDFQLPLIQVNKLAHWRFWKRVAYVSVQLNFLSWCEKHASHHAWTMAKGDLNVKWLNHIWVRNMPGYHPFTDERWHSQSHKLNQNRRHNQGTVRNMHTCIQALEAESWRFFQRGVCVFDGLWHYTHVDHFDHMNSSWKLRCHTILRCWSDNPVIDS